MARRTGRNPDRKVWIYSEKTAPPLGHLLRGGDAGKMARKHWVGGTLQNALDIALFYAMKALPAGVCSALGARLGLFSMPRWHGNAIRKTQANLKKLMPAATDAEREALMRRNWENQGRLMTEFSVVNRMAKSENRVTVSGIDHILAAAGRGPLILMGLHTGNWELIWSIVSRLGIDAALNYAPPTSPARHWIARRVRHQAGITLLPPGKDAVRPALKRLQAGGTVIIFCDEGLRGKIRGPFLGRKPNADGNLALVARLARRTGATICPVYTLRSKGARFAFHALPTIDLVQAVPDGDLLDDVILLNGVIEPVIRENLDQWYFLDNAL